MPRKKKAYAKPKEKVEYRLDYNEHESLAKLTKKWSGTVEFMREKGEDWLVDVIIYAKSGKISKSHMITMDQVEDWIERFERIKGFERAQPGG